ncbi:MAG: ATP-binding protein [Thermoplasmata archaeon]|nr:ATP-binding protein [Thermoplasmata archaeon]
MVRFPVLLLGAFGLSLFRRPEPDLAVAPPYPLLVDMVPGVLLVLDEKRMVRYANGAVVPVLGYEVSEVLGRPLSAFFVAESRAALANLLDGLQSGEPRRRLELPAKSRMGATVPVEVTAEPVGRSKSGPVAVFLRNLTERDALTEALALRAAELARSNKDLEQFAYVASHDLQEPLRMVGSYTQLLGEKYAGKLDSDAEEYLRFTHDGVVRMRQLIDDLLAFARVGTRGKPFEPVAVEEVFDQAVGNLEAAIAAKGAVVTHGPLPKVEGDRGQLVQLLQNLIGNGLKFHGSGPPHIRVEAVREGAVWRISVQDDGIGIAPEYQAKIFLMFQRLHTREEYPGSGIGLAICKRVVERHGGQIGVESTGRPGHGTRFWFTLSTGGGHPTLSTAPAVAEHDVSMAERAQSLIQERLQELI